MIFALGAVQEFVNILDLKKTETCVYLQRSASTITRTDVEFHEENFECCLTVRSSRKGGTQTLQQESIAQTSSVQVATRRAKEDGPVAKEQAISGSASVRETQASTWLDAAFFFSWAHGLPRGKYLFLSFSPGVGHPRCLKAAARLHPRLILQASSEM